VGQNKPDCLGGVAHVTRDSDITFKVKRSKVNSRSSGRFTHRGLNASGSCSGVGHVKLLLRCGVLGGARRFGAHRGRRGAGISWRPPAYSLFCLGELQQIVYSRTVSDYIQLKRVLIVCWAQLSQDTLNRAIDQLPKRLMMVIKAKGEYVEFRLD